MIISAFEEKKNDVDTSSFKFSMAFNLSGQIRSVKMKWYHKINNAKQIWIMRILNGFIQNDFVKIAQCLRMDKDLKFKFQHIFLVTRA